MVEKKILELLLGQDNLRIVIREIKAKYRLSLRAISREIGTNIKNLLYGTTNSIDYECFRKLENLFQKEIPHNIKSEEPFQWKELKKIIEESGATLIDILQTQKEKNPSVYAKNIIDSINNNILFITT